MTYKAFYLVHSENPRDRLSPQSVTTSDTPILEAISAWAQILGNINVDVIGRVLLEIVGFHYTR